MFPKGFHASEFLELCREVVVVLAKAYVCTRVAVIGEAKLLTLGNGEETEIIRVLGLGLFHLPQDFFQVLLSWCKVEVRMPDETGIPGELLHQNQQ